MIDFNTIQTFTKESLHAAIEAAYNEGVHNGRIAELKDSKPIEYDFTYSTRFVDGLFEETATTKTNEIYPGLTKREQFAAMAMQGLISDYGRITDYAKSELIMKEGIEKSISIQSVGYADALLKALEALEADK